MKLSIPQKEIIQAHKKRNTARHCADCISYCTKAGVCEWVCVCVCTASTLFIQMSSGRAAFRLASSRKQRDSQQIGYSTPALTSAAAAAYSV